MNPSQAFGVAVRTIGLLLTIYTTPSIYSLGVMMAFSNSNGSNVPTILSLILAVAGMLVGLWLLRGPKSLLAYAYSDEA